MCRTCALAALATLDQVLLQRQVRLVHPEPGDAGLLDAPACGPPRPAARRPRRDRPRGPSVGGPAPGRAGRAARWRRARPPLPARGGVGGAQAERTGAVRPYPGRRHGHEQQHRADRPCTGGRPDLPGAHVRLPDERPRLRAARRASWSPPATPAPPTAEPADVVVLNTCAVRENADNRLYGNLGHLAPVKASRPGMQIAVGGCLAQKDRGEITRRAPWVDVVFGTHNLGSLPALLERARVLEEAQVEILESLEVFPSTLPTRRESPYAAWVVDLGRLQQHLHVLHRAVAARRAAGPPARRHPRRGARPGRRGRPRGDAARPERELLRRRPGRPRRVRAAAARGAAASTGSSGCGSPRRTRATSPTTSSRPWPRRRP